MSTGVLLSGGMDSVVALYWARERRRDVSAWSVDYGQKHRKCELDAAKRVAVLAGVPHRVLTARVPWAPMTGGGVVLPGRNIILLSIVAAQVATRSGGEHSEVVIGANLADYDGFPDCRPEFLAAASKAISLGLGAQVDVVAPFILNAKYELVSAARSFGAWDALAISWSCYEGGEAPCGTCGACVKRAEGFEKAGEVDPWHA